MNPHDMNAQMEFDFFSTFKGILLSGLIKMEDEDYIPEENPFEDFDDDFRKDYVGDFIIYYEKIRRYDVVHLLQG